MKSSKKFPTQPHTGKIVILAEGKSSSREKIFLERKNLRREKTKIGFSCDLDNTFFSLSEKKIPLPNQVDDKIPLFPDKYVKCPFVAYSDCFE
jgi:hypothetical protein